MPTVSLRISQQALADFCRRNHIRKLSVFGSALRPDFRPDSDVDVAAVFEPDHIPGLIALGRMERELSGLFGRPADLHMMEALKPRIRSEVLASGEVQYERG